jgi:hypothetical protein
MMSKTRTAVGLPITWIGSILVCGALMYSQELKTLDLMKLAPPVPNNNPSVSVARGGLTIQQAPVGLLNLSLKWQRRLYSSPTTGDPHYALPLSMELRSVRAASGGGLAIEVLLRNTGSSSFYLPISRDDSFAPLLPGNVERRLFRFEVYLKPAGQKDVRVSAVTTEGSRTKQDSLMELKPQEAIVVRYLAPLPSSVAALLKSGENVQVEAACVESRLAEGQYEIDEVSVTVRSVNNVRL